MGVQSFLRTIVQNAATFGETAPSAERGDFLEKVPPALFNCLAEKGRNLPAPDVCKATVENSLLDAIACWQANPDIENNSLVFLSRPVEDLTAILKATLQQEQSRFTDYTIHFLMQGYQRPFNPLEIKEHIRRELEKLPEGEEGSPTIVVIPRLEQCFLRCIQGWEGIEYLQNFTTRDPTRFWVFGCNHWAWTFLDRVCQISAYLEQPVSLPELSIYELKQWLLPFFSDAITVLNLEAQAHEPIITLDVGTDSYWSSLTNLSSGIGSTSARLWLKSLRVRVSNGLGNAPSNELSDELSDELGDEAVDAAVDAANEQAIISLLPAKPALPGAIAFSTVDRYLLHSLLIHGVMTRSHLALSLGEAERRIRDRLQVLKRESIILQKGRRLSVHPAHYPKLYSELKNNNFLIGER